MTNTDSHDVSRANKALVAEYHERLWAEGDLAAIEEFWDPGATVHVPGFESNMIETLRDDATRYQAAFTDVETRIDHLLCDGDLVTLRWTTSGVHVGPYGRIAATGKRIEMAGTDVLRVADGRLVECWSIWDGLSVFEQMNALPDLW